MRVHEGTDIWWATYSDLLAGDPDATHEMLESVCPRCANGRPHCIDRKKDGTTYTHDETCAMYAWAEDVCPRCARLLAEDAE